jgi:putative restriction endonuclease
MPLSPLDRTVLDKAAIDEAFGIRLPEQGEWLAYDALANSWSIRLSKAGQDYLVGINHEGAAFDLTQRWPRWTGAAELMPPAGFFVFAVNDTEPLHHLVREMWRLACSLPSEPLRKFERETRNLPRATEAERWVVQRIGQDIFRDSLMKYWNGQCAVTCVQEPALLIASHIKPWAKCERDDERLDVYNGLLLAAHLDKAFDAGLISFADDGCILFADRFNERDRQVLNLNTSMRLARINEAHLPRLRWHRLEYGIEPKPQARLD